MMSDFTDLFNSTPDPVFYGTQARELLEEIAADGEWDRVKLQRVAEALFSVADSQNEEFVRRYSHALLKLTRDDLPGAFHAFAHCLGLDGAKLCSETRQPIA